ncbi:MAG: hypothetical protein Q4A01_07705 [Coriobacteriales bacterium]|nr:hypothetical protein [Coriobacteriales bacterium]
MARRGHKKMTLSEHLALRKQAADRTKAQEEERSRTIQAFKELDAQVVCNCPACTRARQRANR